jgi:competence protein ComEC
VTRGISIFWKKAPFLKIFIATATGILIQWYQPVEMKTWLILFGINLFLLLSFSYISNFLKFKYGFLPGINAFIIFSSFGAWLVFTGDIRNDKKWFGKDSTAGGYTVTICESLIEKSKSYKAIAEVTYTIDDSIIQEKNGKLIIYFQKPAVNEIKYGSRIYIKKSPEPIKNFITGFNYERYCLFNGITHQVFLKKNDFIVLPSMSNNRFARFIFTSREKIISVIRKYIRDEQAAGLAEALLIGYKNDLDKEIVQDYSNTGVVHIIAISGLHLGLVYVLLSVVTFRFRRPGMSWARALIIIAGLWIFSLLAGAQPSILRSALMFTCIAIGELMSRRTSVYNSLAVSAFIIVCINPFSLWDIGFQLSYAALVSILVFMRPVYNFFYIKNKLLDLAWKLNSVTLAAQVLTIPLCIYHFGQFPNYFLLSNFIAVPLSSIILLGEIFLCIIFFIEPLASFWGKILTALIRVMNLYIEKIAALPWSMWKGLEINFLQVILSYVLIISFSIWLLEKNPAAFKFGLAAVAGLIFSALWTK